VVADSTGCAVIENRRFGEIGRGDFACMMNTFPPPHEVQSTMCARKEILGRGTRFGFQHGSDCESTVFWEDEILRGSCRIRTIPASSGIRRERGTQERRDLEGWVNRAKVDAINRPRPQPANHSRRVPCFDTGFDHHVCMRAFKLESDIGALDASEPPANLLRL